MDAPQSDAELLPFIQALQGLDARLDIIWNPRAVMEKRGGFDASGRVLDPQWGGRWEVILHDVSAKTANWRAHTRVCLVTEPVTVATGLQAMQADGAYAPVGDWLVEFIRAADQWNQEKLRHLGGQLDVLNETLERNRFQAALDAAADKSRRLYHAGTARGHISEFHPVNISLSRVRHD